MNTLPGTIDLIIFRTLATMGPQHAYGVAARVSQVSGNLYSLNQGTLYPAWSVSNRKVDQKQMGHDRQRTGSQVLFGHAVGTKSPD
jgi:hypothetical protein